MMNWSAYDTMRRDRWGRHMDDSAKLTRLPIIHLSERPRCGRVLYGCAFLQEEQVDDTNANSSIPSWRHGLILSRPGRYERAAMEVRRAGFLPTMVPGIFRNWSRCRPRPNWSDPAERMAVKLDNAIEAYRAALEHISSTNVPAAIFEDDVVLATSRREVQAWLDEMSITSIPASHAVPKTWREGHYPTHESFPRRQYDLGKG